MTTFYLDSSALVKRYAIEAGTAWVREICEQSDNVIAVALFGLAEMAAAVNGKRRGGAIDAATQYSLLDVDQFVVDAAIDLTSRYRLRGYDAIHLACALRLNRALIGLQLPPLTLVSADGDLLRAAKGEHLMIENPNEHP